jgi:hypothetical protein
MTTTNALVTRWRRLPSRRVPPPSSIPREDDRMSHAYFSDGTSAFFVELAEPVFVPCSACSRLHHAWPHAADPRALSMMSGCEPAVAPHPFSPRLEAWKKAAAACAPFCVCVFLVGLKNTFGCLHLHHFEPTKKTYTYTIKFRTVFKHFGPD